MTDAIGFDSLFVHHMYNAIKHLADLLTEEKQEAFEDFLWSLVQKYGWPKVYAGCALYAYDPQTKF